MYFPVLERLKEFNEFDVDDLNLFDDILYLIYRHRYQTRFHPRVYRYFGIKLDESKWIFILEKLSQLGVIQINYELCCQNSDETIEIYHKYDDIPLNSTKLCINCDEEFIVDEDDIFITYSFNNSFKPVCNHNHRGDDFFRIEQSTNKEKKNLFTLDDYKQYPERFFERIINDRREELKNLLNKALSSEKNTDKGSLFEDLAEKFLSSPYLELYERNKRYSTGEIDIVFKVRTYEGTLFQQFEDILIVECKNWVGKVGSSELKVFAIKMKDVNTNVGIFFSKMGITGNNSSDAKGVIRDQWRAEKKAIIVINYEDIENVLSGEINLYELLMKKYYDTKLI